MTRQRVRAMLGRVRRLESGGSAAETFARRRAEEDALLRELREMKFSPLTEERRAALGLVPATREMAIEALRKVVSLAPSATPPAGEAGRDVHEGDGDRPQ